MIDVKSTTLVPSFRALIAFKRTGDLTELMAEGAAERAVIVQHVGCELRDVTVLLAPAALAVSLKDLDRAAADPGVRRRLTRIHAIHPEAMPHAFHRHLAVDQIGHSRHGDDEWLWAGGPAAAKIIAGALEQRLVQWRSPLSDLWPVDEATIVPVHIKSTLLIEHLSALADVVDVDRNGRPYPSL